MIALAEFAVDSVDPMVLIQQKIVDERICVLCIHTSSGEWIRLEQHCRLGWAQVNRTIVVEQIYMRCWPAMVVLCGFCSDGLVDLALGSNKKLKDDCQMANVFAELFKTVQSPLLKKMQADTVDATES